jgi:hypothetical protein
LYTACDALEEGAVERRMLTVAARTVGYCLGKTRASPHHYDHVI